ncbi:MAG: LysR family transcriptional regulator [Proteobacteria bacterium]|nr:LysR family transcriptional regulator [Pseudomonadota bacterium]
MGLSFDMDALRALVVGADLGSFARAAVRLGRSQSAISMQIKKLEQQAGQKLFRKSGRTLQRTAAGDALLSYARRIIALNDEAATSVGAAAAAATVRLALPQDFAEDVLPAIIAQFCREWPGVHIEARAGRNYTIADDIAEGRLDVAIAFSRPEDGGGKPIVRLPMIWVAPTKPIISKAPLPLVLYDHACLFRQAAMDALDADGKDWRLALTTPSLPGVWAALRAGVGISVRTPYALPANMRDVTKALRLPSLPAVDVRILAGTDLSPAAADLREITARVLKSQVGPAPKKAIDPSR